MNIMNGFALFPVALVLASATAFADTPTGPPKMTFRAFAPETKMSTTDRVTPFRSYETVIVIIKDNISCGQKPVNPSFAIKGSQIALRYELTPAAPGARTCILGSEFKIDNVPDQELTVAFSGGAEAATVASMRKCPNYNPKTDDVWECLVPAETK